MNVIEVLLISIALGMDCFTVSFSCGILQQRMGRQVWAMAFLFGLFQSLLLLLGWATTSMFSQAIAAYDHWIAFGLLSYLGISMIRDGMRAPEQRRFDPSRLKVLLTLALATSIDALAVGCSFVALGVRSMHEILVVAAIVGVISFMMSHFGKYIGVKLGKQFKWPASQIGGAILIIIGIKVLLEHLWV